MRLIVGLGNPGPRYAFTRHNVGFRVVECLAKRHGVALDGERFGGRFGRGSVRTPEGGIEVALLLPETWMNGSGDAVAAAVRGLSLEEPAEELIVVLDDVDLPFGRLRLRPAGGGGGHRGLSHVIERLGHRSVPRLRFGVGRPPEGRETSDYVLERFDADEEAALAARLDAAADAIEAVLREGLVPAMNRFNREAEASD